MHIQGASCQQWQTWRGWTHTSSTTAHALHCWATSSSLSSANMTASSSWFNRSPQSWGQAACHKLGIVPAICWTLSLDYGFCLTASKAKFKYREQVIFENKPREDHGGLHLSRTGTQHQVQHGLALHFSLVPRDRWQKIPWRGDTWTRAPLLPLPPSVVVLLLFSLVGWAQRSLLLLPYSLFLPSLSKCCFL